MAPRIEHLVTAGTFSLDGGTWDVDNNVWLIGNDDEVLVIDAAHDPDKILAAVGDRDLVAVVCTHGHNDHINAAFELQQAVASNDQDKAPIVVHDDDRMLWDQVYADRSPDGSLKDGQTFEVGGATLHAIHTPGHSPGGVCLHLASENVLFSGDTLFKGGPGATGRSFSDFPTIIDSIRNRLLALPPETVVHTGHGDSTTIGDEAPDLDEWIARGH